MEMYNYPDAKGHFHNNAAPPPEYRFLNENKWHPWSTLYTPKTQVNTNFYFYIRMPQYATEFVMSTVWNGACTGSEYLKYDVKIDGLQELPASPDYILLPQNDKNHPQNHYGTSTMNQTLTDLAHDGEHSVQKQKR